MYSVIAGLLTQVPQFGACFCYSLLGHTIVRTTAQLPLMLNGHADKQAFELYRLASHRRGSPNISLCLSAGIRSLVGFAS
jgi:hypothetical protein